MMVLEPAEDLMYPDDEFQLPPPMMEVEDDDDYDVESVDHSLTTCTDSSCGF